MNCTPFGCDEGSGTCYGSCSGDAQCLSGYRCVVATGRCVSLDVRAARITAAGVVQDPSGFDVSGIVPYDQDASSVAFDGTNFLVVWRDMASGSSIRGIRVSPGGTIVGDPGGFQISTGGFGASQPAVALVGSNYVVVWADTRSGDKNIFAALVNTSGTVLTSGILVSGASGEQSSPAIAVAGSLALVVWADRRSGSTSDIYGARVNASGSVLDSSGVAISTATGDQTEPTVAFDGTNFGVVWSDSRSGIANRDLYGSIVNTSGAVSPSIAIQTSPSSPKRHPALAFGSSYYLVAWDDARSGNLDIYASRLNTSLTRMDTLSLSTVAGDQSEPAVAWDGSNWLVAWSDARTPPERDVYGTRVSSSGTVLDPAGIGIAVRSKDQYEPSAAWGGGVYLVPMSE